MEGGREGGRGGEGRGGEGRGGEGRREGRREGREGGEGGREGEMRGRGEMGRKWPRTGHITVSLLCRDTARCHHDVVVKAAVLSCVQVQRLVDVASAAMLR